MIFFLIYSLIKMTFVVDFSPFSFSDVWHCIVVSLVRFSFCRRSIMNLIKWWYLTIEQTMNHCGIKLRERSRRLKNAIWSHLIPSDPIPSHPIPFHLVSSYPIPSNSSRCLHTCEFCPYLESQLNLNLNLNLIPICNLHSSNDDQTPSVSPIECVRISLIFALSEYRKQTEELNDFDYVVKTQRMIWRISEIDAGEIVWVQDEKLFLSGSEHGRMW
jgi:hypothetical protein